MVGVAGARRSRLLVLIILLLAVPLAELSPGRVRNVAGIGLLALLVASDAVAVGALLVALAGSSAESLSAGDSPSPRFVVRMSWSLDADVARVLPDPDDATCALVREPVHVRTANDVFDRRAHVPVIDIRQDHGRWRRSSRSLQRSCSRLRPRCSSGGSSRSHIEVARSRAWAACGGRSPSQSGSCWDRRRRADMAAGGRAGSRQARRRPAVACHDDRLGAAARGTGEPPRTSCGGRCWALEWSSSGLRCSCSSAIPTPAWITRRRRACCWRSSS